MIVRIEVSSHKHIALNVMNIYINYHDKKFYILISK